MEKNIKQEFFELCLNTEGHSISTCDLIAYLTNANELITSINQTLNTKYSIGFDQVEVDVIALKEGSFKIPLCIKKITNNATFASIAGSVIGVLALNLLTKKSELQTGHDGKEIVRVTSDELLKNKRTVNAVGSIARMVVESDSIKDITVTYEKTNGEQEQVTINKRVLSQVMYDEPEEESMSSMVTNVTLEIVSPVFVDKPAPWKVIYDNRIVKAQMADKDFLEEVNLQKLSFAPGDEIIADMEVVAKTTESGIRHKYNIRKVHKSPRFSRIIRNQPSLFDNIE